MTANGDVKKHIWSTEFGAPTGTSTRSLSEAAQARLISLAYARLQGWRWAGPGFLHSYRDRGLGASVEDSFGLVRADWSKKPSYRAYELRAKSVGSR
jgi:hypothetical protein